MHLNKIVNVGIKKSFQISDLFHLEPELTSADFKGFSKFFNKYKEEYKKNVVWGVFQYSRKYWYWAYVTFFCRYVLECSFPLLVKEILD